MPGKKRGGEKAGDRKRGGGGSAGGDMAAFMGFGLCDGGGDDAELEAELAALSGEGSGSKGREKKGKKGAVMSASEIDSMVASAKSIGEGGGESEDEGVPDEEENEEDLLEELAELEGDGGEGDGKDGKEEEEDEGELLPVIPKSGGRASSKPVPPSSGGESPAAVIAARLKMYEGALAAAKGKGDAGKERRCARSVGTLTVMLQQARAGKAVNMEELPPPVSAGAGVAAAAGGGGGGGGEEDDEELESWMQEDAKPSPSPSPVVPKPTPSPRTSLTPKAAELSATPMPSKPSGGGGGSSVPPPQGAPGDSTLQTLLERTSLYQRALAEAEGSGDGSKVRRYTRSLEVLAEMTKNAKAKRPINVEDIPPIVTMKGSTPAGSGAAAQSSAAIPKPDSLVAKETSLPTIKPPQPQPQSKPKAPPSDMIDLNAPEFDEFNLTEDDIAAFSMNFVDDRQPKQEAAPVVEKPQKMQPSAVPKPQPPQPKSKAPPPDMIDLNAPEFDEFNLTEDDMAAFSMNFVDDRQPKQGAASTSTPTIGSILPTLGSTLPTPGSTLPTPSSTLPTPSPKVSASPLTSQQPPARDLARALLEERRTQYLAAMKDAKGKGNEELAKECGKTAVQFKKILGALEQGQPVDLSLMPGPPVGYTSSYNLDPSQLLPPPPHQEKPPSLTQASASAAPPTPRPQVVQEGGGDGGGEGDLVDPGIPVPRTPLEALEQRLVKYREAVEGAQQKGDGSRARRMGRIVKQYEDAIKLTRAGKPVDYSELPAPPGYPPIPAPAARQGGARVAQQQAPPTGTKQQQQQSATTVVTTPRLHPSMSDMQLQAIQQRSHELKVAAKEAQSKGDKETAVRYMHLFKGVQTMLEAAQGGLPVDMSQLPSSPYASLSATRPSAAAMAHLKLAAEGDGSTFDLIERQLERQKGLCLSNATTYEEMGNTATALQYKNMCENCERELLAIKGIRSKGLSPPKFSMETRKFSIVHSNVHLGSNQCEVTVIRGLDIQASLAGCDGKDLNVCIELEFPLPSESPQKASLPPVKGSQSPEVNVTKVFAIDRKGLRALQRVMKRTPLTCTLFHRRTLRKDIFLGVAHVSLEQLETKCEVRSCFDLLDEKGKKPIGGKLEVVVRLREPLSGRDEEEKEEQWLVFDEPIVAPSQVSMPKAGPPTTKKQAAGEAHRFVTDIAKTTSMEALKFEASLAQKLLKGGDASVAQRLKLIQARFTAVNQQYKSDPQFRQRYPALLRQELKMEQQMEQKLQAEGRTSDSRIVQYRIQAIEKELKALEQK